MAMKVEQQCEPLSPLLPTHYPVQMHVYLALSRQHDILCWNLLAIYLVVIPPVRRGVVMPEECTPSGDLAASVREVPARPVAPSLFPPTAHL